MAKSDPEIRTFWDVSSVRIIRGPGVPFQIRRLFYLRTAIENFELLVVTYSECETPIMAPNGTNGIVADEEIDAEIDYSDIEAK